MHLVCQQKIGNIGHFFPTDTRRHSSIIGDKKQAKNKKN